MPCFEVCGYRVAANSVLSRSWLCFWSHEKASWFFSFSVEIVQTCVLRREASGSIFLSHARFLVSFCLVQLLNLMSGEVKRDMKEDNPKDDALTNTYNALKVSICCCAVVTFCLFDLSQPARKNRQS